MNILRINLQKQSDQKKKKKANNTGHKVKNSRYS